MIKDKDIIKIYTQRNKLPELVHSLHHQDAGAPSPELTLVARVEIIVSPNMIMGKMNIIKKTYILLCCCHLD